MSSLARLPVLDSDNDNDSNKACIHHHTEHSPSSNTRGIGTNDSSDFTRVSCISCISPASRTEEFM